MYRERTWRGTKMQSGWSGGRHELVAARLSGRLRRRR
jgi:hypothetical protein